MLIKEKQVSCKDSQHEGKWKRVCKKVSVIFKKMTQLWLIFGIIIGNWWDCKQLKEEKD